MAQDYTGTYDPNDPTGTPLNEVRTMVGDVNDDHFWISDGLILARIADTNSVEHAAIRVIDDILAKFAFETDTSGGRSSTQRTQRNDQLRETKKALRRMIRRAPRVVLSNAVVSEVEALDNDENLRQPINRIGKDEIQARLPQRPLSRAKGGC